MEMPEEPAIEQHALNGRAEYEAAINTLLQHTQKKLCIFDFSLEDGGYNSPQRYELFKNFLLTSRANRLQIVVHDTDYITKSCPRLLMLLHQFSHAIEINETQLHAKSVYDPFMIADERHYLHRFHYEDSRAVLSLHDPTGAGNLILRFEEIWEASGPAVSATTLGL
jgi:hypothetical protein